MSATLTVTHSENIRLNGTQQGSSNSFTIDSITQIFKNIVTVPSGADTTIAAFKSTVGTADGALDVENVKYIRVTNLDSTNPVNLSFQIDAGEDDSAADEMATFQLLAGQSWIMGDADECASVDDDAASIDVTFHPLESIIADSVSENVQVEVLIASIN